MACSSFDEETPIGDGGIEATTPETGTNDSAAGDAGDGGCAPTRVGLFDPASGRFMLFPENKASPLIEFTINGATGGLPVAGHFKAGAPDTVGYRGGAFGGNTFYLFEENRAGTDPTTFSFGAGGAGIFPFTGDWDGDGRTQVGIYAPEQAAWFFRLGDGGAEPLGFGAATDAGTPRPVAGRFGPAPSTDAMGIFDYVAGTFYLKYTRTPGAADATIVTSHTGKGVWPIAGDWAGCSTVSVGLWDDSAATFFLLRENLQGSAEDEYPLGTTYANHGYIPIVGRWKP